MIQTIILFIIVLISMIVTSGVLFEIKKREILPGVYDDVRMMLILLMVVVFGVFCNHITKHVNTNVKYEVNYESF